MIEYRCGNCSYIYNEKDGDSTAGVLPGTTWEALPQSWACPHCGSMKHFFEPLPLQCDKIPLDR